jgi:predicted DNA-binding transcriptional regulator AlpA
MTRIITKALENAGGRYTEKPKERPIRIEKVVELSGYSRSSIYRLVGERKIPCHKPTNGRLFFYESELLDFLSGNRRATSDELAEQATAILNGEYRK